MGNDGGSIPDRRDLVKNKPKAEQADKANQTRARWWFCALSKKPLQQPVVSCRLGRLYNKDALIEFLLDRTLYGDGNNICGHVKSLKDVKVLNLTANPDSSAKLSDTDLPVARFACPLTMKEMNGAVPFVYLRPCGCVFSQKGLRAMATTPDPESKEDGAGIEKSLSLCPQCGTKYDAVADVFTINPGPEEELQMMEQLAAHLASVQSRPKKRKAATALESTAPVEEQPALKKSHVASKKLAEGMAEQEKKRLAGMSEAVKSIYQGKGAKAIRSNWISQGTFTRYAA